MHKNNNNKKKKTNVLYIIYIQYYINMKNKQKQTSAQPEIANNKIEIIDQSRKILPSKNLYTWP